MSPSRLPFRVRLAVFLRSFWLQSSLNYEGMQNLGRLFALAPVARWLKLQGASWAEFVARHLSYFNSNPFIATLGLGALARLEADAAERGDGSARMVERMSLRLSASLGAVGDALFWGVIRPQVVLTGSLAAVAMGPAAGGLMVGIWILWVGSYRWLCLKWGWEVGRDVASVLSSGRFRRAGVVAGLAGAFCAGAVGAFLFLASASGGEPGATEGAIVRVGAFVGAGISSALLLGKRQHAVWAVVAAGVWVAVAAFLAYIFGL